MRLTVLLLLTIFVVTPAFGANTDISQEALLNKVYNQVSVGDGRQTVTNAGTRVQVSTTSQPFGTATICAETDNTNPVTVGGATVVGALATRRGVPLAAGDCYTFQARGDLDDIYIDSITNTEGITFTFSN